MNHLTPDDGNPREDHGALVSPPPTGAGTDPDAGTELTWSIERDPDVDYDEVQHVGDVVAHYLWTPVPNAGARPGNSYNVLDAAVSRRDQLLKKARLYTAFACFQLLLMTPMAIANLFHYHGDVFHIVVLVVIVLAGLVATFDARRFYKSYNHENRHVTVLVHQDWLGRKLTVEEYQAAMEDLSTLPQRS